MARFFRRIAGLFKRALPLSRQTRVVAALVPARSWYWLALAVSRWQGRLVGRLGSNGVFTEAFMRDLWIQDLTLHGPFPIPMRTHGREALETYAAPGPVIYHWSHLPLSECPVRAIIEMGYRSPAVVADPVRADDEGLLALCGMAEKVLVIPADSGLYLRMRQLLRQGVPVCSLADQLIGGEMSSKTLRLAGRMGVPVIFAWGELGPDGVVDITFQAAPYPFCETEEEIAVNMAFLEDANERVLQSLGVSREKPSRPA